MGKITMLINETCKGKMKCKSVAKCKVERQMSKWKGQIYVDKANEGHGWL